MLKSVWDPNAVVGYKEGSSLKRRAHPNQGHRSFPTDTEKDWPHGEPLGNKTNYASHSSEEEEEEEAQPQEEGSLQEKEGKGVKTPSLVAVDSVKSKDYGEVCLPT